MQQSIQSHDSSNNNNTHRQLPTMVTSRKCPLEWNNHAVLLLEMGRIHEAKLLLQQALQTLGSVQQEENAMARSKRHHAASEQQHCGDDDDDAAMAEEEISTKPTVPEHAFTGWSSPLIGVPPQQQGEERDVGVKKVFVYSRFLYIHPHFQDDCFELYAAGILFNLGLVQHVLALKGDEQNTSAGLSSYSIAHYKESYMFYEYAMKNLSLLEQQQQDQGNARRHTKEQGILKALLLNNSGHIFSTDSLDSDAALHCFTASIGLLVNESNTSENENEHRAYPAASLDDLDIGSLLRNILLCRPAINAAAQA